MATDATAPAGATQDIESLRKRLAEHERERDALAAAVAEGQRRIELLIEFSPDIIYELDPQGQIVFISRAVERLGWRPEELVGSPISALVHPGDRDEGHGRYCEMRTGDRATRNMQLRFVAKAGHARDFEVSAVPMSLSARGLWNVPDREIQRPDKTFLGTLGIARDDTERRRAEQALQRAHDEMEQRVLDRTAELVRLNQALEQELAERKRAEEERRRLQEQLLESQKMEAIGKLAGGVAHDFNNRLTVIKGCCDMILKAAGAAGPIAADVRQIQNAADGAAALTRQLLLFGRRQRSEPVALDLAKLVTSMDKMLRRLMGEQVRLVCESARDAARVFADPGQMEQTVMNLVINARDAMPQGGTITIGTRNVTARGKACVRLSVQDTGTGIPPEILDRIFEPFFTTKPPGHGTGLGLSVVYGIVELHGGWIDVDTRVGEGTTFHVYLPVHAGPPQARTEAAAVPPQAGRAGTRVLCVEDETDLRRMFVKALSLYGFTVVEAANCREARERFAEASGQFDVLMSDVVLPDGNGIELVEAIRASHPRLRILMTSGYTDQHSSIDRIRREGLHFLQKPYELGVLVKTINDVLAADEAGAGA